MNFIFILIDIIDNIMYDPYYVTRTPTNENAGDTDRDM